MSDRVINSWTVGEYTIEEIANWNRAEPPLYRYTIGDAKPSSTYYRSLDMALAEAIAAKYMGEAGASGTAVATAAAWFGRMIGMQQL
jgi:hypothetical protein